MEPVVCPVEQPPVRWLGLAHAARGSSLRMTPPVPRPMQRPPDALKPAEAAKPEKAKAECAKPDKAGADEPMVVPMKKPREGEASSASCPASPKPPKQPALPTTSAERDAADAKALMMQVVPWAPAQQKVRCACTRVQLHAHGCSI